MKERLGVVIEWFACVLAVSFVTGLAVAGDLKKEGWILTRPHRRPRMERRRLPGASEGRKEIWVVSGQPRESVILPKAEADLQQYGEKATISYSPTCSSIPRPLRA